MTEHRDGDSTGDTGKLGVNANSRNEKSKKYNRKKTARGGESKT